MSILPLQPARVSNLLQSMVAQQSLTATEASLLTVQNQLSTGQQVSVPSDNPQAASAILVIQRTLQRRQAFSTNIQAASSQLGQVDNALSNVESLIQQAQNIASANVGSDVGGAQRQGAAEIVRTLVTEAQSLGNTSIGGMYLFGGDKANQPPFVNGPNGISFVGSTTVLKNVFDENTLLPTQVNGAHVFGALSSRVAGADVTPAVTAQTLVSDLAGAGGNGVHLSSIQVGNGGLAKVIDLSTASTVGDVAAAINAAGVGGIVAAVTPAGLTLTGSATDDIAVADTGGTTAADLGIATPNGGAGAGAAVTGTPLAPRVTLLTPLSTLSGGAGLDPAGLAITNGTSSKTITFPPTGTVETLLNQINGAKLGVQAQINAAGNGIDVINTTQGSNLSIAENGGTTATELGLRTFSPSTPLDSLNDGKGITTSAAGDFKITRADGTSFTVSLTGASTVQNAIDAVNAADAGGGVTAGFSATGNGVTLKDTTTGSGTLTVTPVDGSTVAAALGLTAAASGKQITGTDVHTVATSGVFSDLQALVTALQAGDQRGITAAGEGLKNDYNRVVNVRAQAGAQVKDLQNRQTTLDNENLTTKSLLSGLQDTDFTKAISKFQLLQTSLQASLQTTARLSSLSLLNFLG